ncbi:hypothetical protein C8J57DRAFT_1222626 [Mycena rebaudengoi]|nr:hypothetical protein C8J57DRAFT_1222626 [Mycena rebaudengoi]
MSDDSYLPSSSPDPPDLGISQAHHWEREEHRQERRELRALRKTGPYTDSRPIKHETPSPSRTPRASAIQATRAFAENDQYGLFLDSQVGENTWVDTVFPEAAIVNSPLHLSIPSDDGNENATSPSKSEIWYTINGGRHFGSVTTRWWSAMR